MRVNNRKQHKFTPSSEVMLQIQHVGDSEKKQQELWLSGLLLREGSTCPGPGPNVGGRHAGITDLGQAKAVF